MIKLTKEQLQIILNHAENTYPEECCGVILGNISFHNKTVVEVITTENAWNSETAVDFPDREKNIENSRRRRYTIAAQEMFEIQKSSRERNLNIIGIFHSHPDYPAKPSEFDCKFAWQEYSYIIVSVAKGKADEIKSWILDDSHQFQQEEVRITINE